MVMKEAIDAHENQGTFSMNGGAIEVLEIFFSVSFAVELLLRLVAHEGRFCFGEGGYWNMFDAVLVATSFVDMYLVATNLNLTFMRVLRLIRIVRALRMVRLLRFAGAMKSMRLMILAIIQSAGPLLIASFVLMMVIFIF